MREIPSMSDGKCTKAFFAGKIDSAGQVASSCSSASTGAGIPTGQAGSHAGWTGNCRDETITRLASACRTSLTRRPVTGIGRGTDRDRAVAARERPVPAIAGIRLVVLGRSVWSISSRASRYNRSNSSAIQRVSWARISPSGTA